VYAVVETGGKQYRVQVGQTVDVERLPAEVGQQVDLERVLMLGGEVGVVVGQPIVPGVSVRATVVGEPRGKKIIVFKYKPKVRYRRKQGHRQNYTRLHIDEIVRDSASASETA
jgi:large subunit ribosomal protein L21